MHQKVMNIRLHNLSEHTESAGASPDIEVSPPNDIYRYVQVPYNFKFL